MFARQEDNIIPSTIVGLLPSAPDTLPGHYLAVKLPLLYSTVDRTAIPPASTFSFVSQDRETSLTDEFLRCFSTACEHTRRQVL